MCRPLVAVVAVVLTVSVAGAQLTPAGLTPRTAVAQTPAVRAATAGLVVVGTVVSIEKDEVEAEPYNGSGQKSSYRVAVVKIDDGLTDTGGQTHVKVGFQPSGVYARPGATFDMKPDAAGLFILSKHHGGSFYICVNNSQPLDATAKTYKDELAQAKKALAAIADPVKALKATDAKDRYFAAAVLVLRYRTSQPGAAAKVQPVAAEESKLILQAVADADWADPEKGVPTPYQTFTRLGLTATDKWQPPAAGGGNVQIETRDAFKTWLAGEGAKYQVKKYAAK